ncbi:nucleoside 2-deoxyribosyltransferase [Variovorax sp. RHLX14]|uniref:nucleoside 2-deoxyribosyltransferase n=1 Tax=Variovorax sp. RHLX14 TaxID=1259731 RepID=UPI003F48205C
MKVYLAGFDVFKPDAASVFASLCSEAVRLQLIPLTPIDGDLPPDAKGMQLARHIFTSNVAKLSEADGVIANLAPFRGQEPDSGTVFEVGFAIARGIPIIGYGVPAGSYADRLHAAMPCTRCEAGLLRERHSGWLVEDFGLPLNLMLACSIKFRATAAEALQQLAEQRCLNAKRLHETPKHNHFKG